MYTYIYTHTYLHVCVPVLVGLDFRQFYSSQEINLLGQGRAGQSGPNIDHKTPKHKTCHNALRRTHEVELSTEVSILLIPGRERECVCVCSTAREVEREKEVSE